MARVRIQSCGDEASRQVVVQVYHADETGRLAPAPWRALPLHAGDAIEINVASGDCAVIKEVGP
jgi:hypothetical protein